MTEKLLSEITTAQVGGPARTYIRATTEAEIVEAVSSADAANEPVLIVGGGSNLLVSDAGFDGTVVHIASTGVEELPIPACGGANVRVQAGTVWDDFVQLSIEKEWSGPAALSGIPGTVGATPVQNVGAYGVEVSEFIAHLGPRDGEVQDLCERRSAFRLPRFNPEAKHGERFTALCGADRGFPVHARQPVFTH